MFYLILICIQIFAFIGIYVDTPIWLCKYLSPRLWEVSMMTHIGCLLGLFTVEFLFCALDTWTRRELPLYQLFTSTGLSCHSCPTLPKPQRCLECTLENKPSRRNISHYFPSIGRHFVMSADTSTVGRCFSLSPVVRWLAPYHWLVVERRPLF